ncbi:hypothetical protein Pcinc_001507 [Petrolisthes cinctipes]|uniref:Integrase catalytic domain-containing protein n=1 Tax=Petrolisthes cinctipes TaxID=88211 RepID=A0AAE1GMT4_PETCI|nr:hypothetical protein Pcinc_001507 [Petrolisthes cinctipes]
MSDIPLLLSKTFMKKMDMVINLGDDSIRWRKAESPWSNGVCERLNAVLKDNVLKIQEGNQCRIETALAWAVAARNALHNNHGFSPNQSVFSFNPGLPNIGEDSPSALENITPSQTVANNLPALRKSREEFIKADANERIRRALSQNIRKTEDENVDIGNYVYYKRGGEDRWRGLARVIGKDGKINILRHGGQIVRAHICRVKGLGNQGNNTDSDVEANKKEKETNEAVNQLQQNHDDEKSNNEQEVTTKVNNDEESERMNVVPKIGKRYEVTMADSKEKINVKILSRAGKATGKYKNCYNFRREQDGQESWMDFGKDVNNIREVRDDEEIMITITDEKTMEAKRKEIDNWKVNKVFEEVEYEGQATISTRWVVTEKHIKEDKGKASDLTVSLEFTQREVDELKSEIKEQTKSSHEKMKQLEERINYQEDYSRKKNVRISGVERSLTPTFLE